MEVGAAGNARGLWGATRNGSDVLPAGLLSAVKAGSAYAHTAASASAPVAIDIFFITPSLPRVRYYLFPTAQLRYFSTVASVSGSAPSWQVAMIARATVLISSFMPRAL